MARWAGHAAFSFANPDGVSFAILPRPSSALARFVTNSRDCRSSTRRVIRLAESAVAFARSVIRNSRPGASDKHINVLYSFDVIPTVRTRSLSSRRGNDKTIRMSARQKISSVAFRGSTLAIQQGYLLGQAPIRTDCLR